MLGADRQYAARAVILAVPAIYWGRQTNSIADIHVLSLEDPEITDPPVSRSVRDAYNTDLSA